MTVKRDWSKEGPMSQEEFTDAVSDWCVEKIAAERRATVERVRHALLHDDDPDKNYLFTEKTGYLRTEFVLDTLAEAAR